MRIAIDNLDGQGPRDYTATLAAAQPLELARSWRQPARAHGALDLNATALPLPPRRARVTVTNDAGAVLFAGSLNTAPVPVWAGVGTTGPVYTWPFAATADALDDAAPATHTLHDGEAAIEYTAPPAASARERAADLTLTGLVEPTAYIAESFLGDGVTPIFDLTEPPFRPSGSATLLDERFARSLDPRTWQTEDPGGFLRLGADGLTLTGGGGLDGSSTLAWNEPLEIAGTLLVVADGVVIASASDGVLCGLYTGDVLRASCLAGFNVRQQAGTTVVTPLVNGVEAGTSLTALNGHRYRLRLRLHCPESVRVPATYTALVDGALQSFGGGTVAAPVTLLFEAQDLGLASSTPATVLHTATLASSPALCRFAPVNSVQLIGSIAQVGITQTGSAWITTTAGDGTVTVRLTGELGDGVDCSLSTQGRLAFYAGRVPLAGDVLTVRYRARQRSVARLADAAAVASSGPGGLPETAVWQGHIASPAARTSGDCQNAALAALAFAGSRAASVTGHGAVINPAADIAPGDLLDLVSEEDTVHVVARAVTVADGHAAPEHHAYRVGFANDWERCLGARLQEGAAEDALLPAAAATTLPVLPPNLPALAVTAATGSSLTVDAGTDPPTGGGFEVRRIDWAFGPGTSGDLVLRSPTRSFTLPRSTQVERFFVRAYDGSNPPLYSRLSSAIFTTLPVGS